MGPHSTLAKSASCATIKHNAYANRANTKSVMRDVSSMEIYTANMVTMVTARVCGAHQMSCITGEHEYSSSWQSHEKNTSRRYPINQLYAAASHIYKRWYGVETERRGKVSFLNLSFNLRYRAHPPHSATCTPSP